MKRIYIIGGGVSGLTLAINVKNSDNEVVILEKNDIVGKKILITGNGRCNFLNDVYTPNFFHSVIPNNIATLINDDNKNKVLTFIKSLGIEITNKNNYYYPFTNKAETIRDALLDECLNKGVKIIYNTKVEKIIKKDDIFIINDKYEADVLACSLGGKTYPLTGSVGDGYELLKNLGIKVTSLFPSLVQLETDGYKLKNIAGVRTNVKVGIYNQDKLIKEEEGELQITDYGVSGICIFNLSRYARKDTSIHINFMPYLNEDADSYLNKRNNTLYKLLTRILNRKLVFNILEELNINQDIYYNDLNDIQKKALINKLTNYTLNVKKTKGFSNAQVTMGGIDLNEINLHSFETKKINNLYVLGEMLDVDGDCGGYNFSFAILSSLIAAEDINHD